MIFDPKLRSRSPVSSKLLEVQPSTSGWLNRVTSCLSISNKINYGYAIALGITIFGTIAGLTIGNYYQQQALLRLETAHKQSKLLSKLQLYMVNFRPVAEFGPVFSQPKEFEQRNLEFIQRVAKVKGLLKKLQASSPTIEGERLQVFLKKYDSSIENYSQKLEAILKQIELTTSKPRGIRVAKQLLVDFDKSPSFTEFYQLSRETTVFIETAQSQQEKAAISLNKVEVLRVLIIAASMLLSVAIAKLLSVYTSRAIARPILAATRVVQQVTEEANFDLQTPVTTEDEVGVLATSLNRLIQKVKHLLEEQKAEAQAQLMQREKMSSLGRMMAGVAHEINNPVNFIYGNLVHASNYVEDLLALLSTYEAEISHPPKAISEQAQEIDLEFLKEDLPKVLHSMQVGADRVRQIVLNLKNFSRLDEAEAHPVDLHACLDSTLLILNNRIKKGITVVRRYNDIPVIKGYMGLLYQVFMNLLSNAIDALEEKTSNSTTKEIRIFTELVDDDWVMVRIGDNGPGITSENQAKIFDAFFTTKPRGIGTGLGLAISYQIVVEKHGGQLTCKSEVGIGTELAIALPIKHPTASASTPPISQVCQAQQYLLS